MKVIVMGAGVIGTATAWYLSRAGHEVTVLERNAGAACETSFGATLPVLNADRSPSVSISGRQSEVDFRFCGVGAAAPRTRAQSATV